MNELTIVGQWRRTGHCHGAFGMYGDIWLYLENSEFKLEKYIVRYPRGKDGKSAALNTEFYWIEDYGKELHSTAELVEVLSEMGFSIEVTQG